MSDDDLPVLTHVLRTGNRPATAAPDTSATASFDPVLDGAFDERFDVHPFDEGPPTRQIVIGHDAPDVPRRPGLTAMAIYDDAIDPLASPRDPFALAQDADVVWSAPMPAIDAPPIVARVDAAAGSAAASTSGEPSIDFSVPSDTAQWAARVRESVMGDLMSRIDTELDARIAQAMHSELETSLAQLQDRLRVHLTDALRDVVARAVQEEIIRIRRSDGAASAP